jgi:hypothetical protein
MRLAQWGARGEVHIGIAQPAIEQPPFDPNRRPDLGLPESRGVLHATGPSPGGRDGDATAPRGTDAAALLTDTVGA